MIREHREQAIVKRWGPTEPFAPFAEYDPRGDCVEFLFSNDAYFARRLDGWVTVYYSEAAPNEVVGGLIKGVRKNLLKRWPGMDIEFVNGSSVEVSVLLRGPAYESDDDVRKQAYSTVLRKIDSAGRDGSRLIADLQSA